MTVHLWTVLAMGFLFFIYWRIIHPLLAVRAALAHVAGPPSASWWRGNWGQVFDRYGWQWHRDIHETYGTVVKIHALFGDQQLLVTDPLALQHVIQKDQHIYEPSDYFVERSRMNLGRGLTATTGQYHVKQRKILAPLFATKFLRQIMPVFYPFGYNLRNVMRNKILNGQDTFNMHKMSSIAALEFVGAGLGHVFDGLNESNSKANEYNDAVKMLNPLQFTLATYRMFLPWIVKIAPPWFLAKLIDRLPWTTLRRVKEITYIMWHISEGILEGRRNRLAEGGGLGKDVLSGLLEFNERADEEDRIQEEELIAHIGTLIFAGHETTATTMAQILYQLSKDTSAQTKLRNEITAARAKDGDLDFDHLLALPFLDAVTRETLRVFPPTPILDRTTRADVVLPLMYPIKSADGKSEIKHIPLKKNTGLLISVTGTNRSKHIWGEDAEEWKPERWLSPLPESVSTARLPGVYSSTITFMGGNRSCLGFKYAEMEMKLTLSLLLEEFEFSPSHDIFWGMSGLVTPTIAGDPDLTPNLPLKVSLVKK